MTLNLKKTKHKKLTNINKLFNGRNNVIKYLHDYGSIILEAKTKVAEEESEPEPSKKKKKNQN